MDQHGKSSLFFFLASHNVTMHAEHIRGVDNRAADALSRDNRQGFFLQVPQARQEPTAIPPGIMQELVDARAVYAIDNY